MTKRDVDAWIAAFQRNQRQLIEAHEEFQRTLVAGHTAFLDAMAASQRILAHAIAGDATAAEAMLEGSDVPSTSTGRWTADVVDAPRPSRLWSVLEHDRTIGVVLDEFGVGMHVIEELRRRGYTAYALAEGDHADVLIFLGALREDPRAVARGAGVEALRTWLSRGFEAAVMVADMSGRFGFDGLDSFRAAYAGLLELASQQEIPCRMIDLDVGFRVALEPAQELVVELLSGGDETPVGLPEDGRVLLVEREVVAERVPRVFKDDAVLVVGASESHIDTLRERWGGKILAIGPPVEGVDADVSCDLNDAMATYEAVDAVRRRGGAIARVLFIIVDQPVSTIHTVLAATAGDPVRHIGAWTPAGSCDAALVAWTFLAEQQRRGEDATLRAVTASSWAEALDDLLFAESESVFWERR